MSDLPTRRAPGSATVRDLARFLVFMALLMAGVLSAPTVLAADDPMRSSFFVVGTIVQVAGLLLAMLGLRRTWRASSPGTRVAANVAPGPAVDGIPMAVVGLGVTAIGIVVQAVGHGLPG